MSGACYRRMGLPRESGKRRQDGIPCGRLHPEFQDAQPIASGAASRLRKEAGVSDLTPQEAAVELRCSRTLVYRLIERGELPGTYELPGSRRKRIPRADVEAFKDRHRVVARHAPVYEPLLASSARLGTASFAEQLGAIERGEAA